MEITAYAAAPRKNILKPVCRITGIKVFDCSFMIENHYTPLVLKRQNCYCKDGVKCAGVILKILGERDSIGELNIIGSTVGILNPLSDRSILIIA